MSHFENNMKIKKISIYCIYIVIACSIAMSAVHAMEVDLNEKDSFVSSLPINTIQISGGTSFDYSNPRGTLVTGDVTVTSPQMIGLLKILFVDPNFSLTDQEKQSEANNILAKLSSNLTANGMEIKAPNSDNVVMITDRSGKYIGSAFGYWTQENILNLFALLGYGSQYETEQQIKAMKIVRKASSTLSNLPQSGLPGGFSSGMGSSCTPGDPGYPNCNDCKPGSIHYPECQWDHSSTGFPSSPSSSCRPGDPGYPNCKSCKPGDFDYPECKFR